VEEWYYKYRSGGFEALEATTKQRREPEPDSLKTYSN
jgi:hypothetical protein